MSIREIISGSNNTLLFVCMARFSKPCPIETESAFRSCN